MTGRFSLLVASVKKWVRSETCFVVSGWLKTLVHYLRRIWLVSFGVDDTFPPSLNSGPTLVLVLENFLQYLKKNFRFCFMLLTALFSSSSLCLSCNDFISFSTPKSLVVSAFFLW